MGEGRWAGEKVGQVGEGWGRWVRRGGRGRRWGRWVRGTRLVGKVWGKWERVLVQMAGQGGGM